MPRSTARKVQPVATNDIALGVLERSVGFRLRRIQNQMARAYVEQVEPLGVRSGAMTALSIIGANPGISQTDLARAAGFDNASVVSLIDELEEKGWAVRTRPPTDRRRHALTLTPAGEKAVNELVSVAVVVESRLTDHLPPDDLQRLKEMLDSIYARCLADDVE